MKETKLETRQPIDYESLACEVGKLVNKKQKAYGDSFGKSGEIIKILFPDGVKPEQYPALLCIVRIIDKLFRVASAKDAFGENPYQDIAGYGLLGMALHQYSAFQPQEEGKWEEFIEGIICRRDYNSEVKAHTEVKEPEKKDLEDVGVEQSEAERYYQLQDAIEQHLRMCRGCIIDPSEDDDLVKISGDDNPFD